MTTVQIDTCVSSWYDALRTSLLNCTNSIYSCNMQEVQNLVVVYI